MLSRDRARVNLRCRLKARAWAILSLFTGPLTKPITIRAGDETHSVVISITPADGSLGGGMDAPISFPGNHFSPLEASIYHVLADRPLLGKVIAKRITQDYNASLRTILSNLVQRKALIHTDEGYARAGATQSSR